MRGRDCCDTAMANLPANSTAAKSVSFRGVIAVLTSRTSKTKPTPTTPMEATITPHDEPNEYSDDDTETMEDRLLNSLMSEVDMEEMELE